MASVDQNDDRIERISSAIRVIPDFPKPGLLLLIAIGFCDSSSAHDIRSCF